MNPAAHGLYEDLSPDMVSPVEDVPGLMPQRNTDASKAVGPFTTPTIARF